MRTFNLLAVLVCAAFFAFFAAPATAQNVEPPSLEELQAECGDIDAVSMRYISPADEARMRFWANPLRGLTERQKASDAFLFLTLREGGNWAYPDVAEVFAGLKCLADEGYAPAEERIRAWNSSVNAFSPLFAMGEISASITNLGGTIRPNGLVMQSASLVAEVLGDEYAEIGARMAAILNAR